MDAHAELQDRLQEMVEQQRPSMVETADEEDLDDLNAVFMSPKVQAAIKGNERMNAFLMDQLR